MTDALSPTEADLWPFVLVCTNDVSGASRVLASLIREHGDLGKVSEARLRRTAMERARLWQEQVWAGAREPGQKLSPLLTRFDVDQRALLWLDAEHGLGLVEIAWVLGFEPPVARTALETLSHEIDGGPESLLPELRASIARAPNDELRHRLREAREMADARNRRGSMFLVVCFFLFVAIMLFVFFDLLNWQGASVTMPDQVRPPAQQGQTP